MLFELFKSLDKKVKEDKERLVSELKSADIKTLIIQMDNNEPISKNIVKIQKDLGYVFKLLFGCCIYIGWIL